MPFKNDMFELERGFALTEEWFYGAEYFIGAWELVETEEFPRG